MAREFPITTENAEGGPRQVVVVSCGACDVQAVLSAHWQGPDRADQISRYLRKRGWLVGRRPSGDRCPDCARQFRRAARQMGGRGFSSQANMNAAIEIAIDAAEEAHPLKTMKARQMFKDSKGKARARNEGGSPELPDAPAPVADAPLPADRETRRLIHAAIDLVWLDEAKGYAGGASDRSVAESLGVPVAWVAEVREFSFGPVMVNEDLEKFRSDLAENMGHLAAIEERQKVLALQVEEAQKFLAREVEVTKSALAALARRAEPLLKAVRP